MAVAPPHRVGPLLRGLAAFTEAERDQLVGRDRDRDELIKLLTAESFRAGLLYGELGVGKTSLLQAAVIPALRERGATIIPCSDPGAPAQSFADALQAAGAVPHQGEAPMAFVARAITGAPGHQQHIFIIDDVDLVLGGGERVVAELGDLYARVVSRGGGRARVLFSCASEHVHALNLLEKRTGSLFPPTSRYELGRLAPADAVTALERTLSNAGIQSDVELVGSIVQGLGRGGPVLPADLQIAALAVRDLRLTSAAALTKLGGAGELESQWLHAAARATGHERTGLRILGELAAGNGSRSATKVVSRLGLTAGEVAKALDALEARGVITGAPGASEFSDEWALRHPVLVPRVREITAPARAAARRAYELLGSKAANKQRLTLGELRQMRTDQIAPVSPEEHEVVKRSRRFYLACLGGIAAIPVLILILLWNGNRGHAYYDLEPAPGGDRVLIRAGRAGLSSFHWLPSSPGFGSVIADTGLSRSMIDPAAWKRIAAHDVGGDLDGWAAGLDKLLRPELAALLHYATTGDEAAIATLDKLARDPEDRAELLIALRPIARGTKAEVAIVEGALSTPSPALQKAAVAVAGAAAQRGADVYRNVLISALVSQDPELRRIALTAVRGLGARAKDLFTAALDRGPDPSARRELQLEVSTAAPDDAPSADGAVAVLADGEASTVLRQRAREQLRRALAVDRPVAIAAAAKLLADDAAPAEARVFAAEVLSDALLGASAGTKDDLAPVADAAKLAFGAKLDAVRAAALPLYTRADPGNAAADLSTLMQGKPKVAMRIAIATAWGELARTRPEEATVALDKLLKDGDNDVRAAAAAAYGYLGRAVQEPLMKMVKNEGYVVAVGAANGLAASAEVGASLNVAIDGVFQLWKQKGRPRRDAARVYARIAKRKPGAVMDYLSASARSTEDPALHPIGVEGLCNAASAGSADARKNLAKVTDDPSTDVRRMVIRCVADGPDPGKNGVAIATALVRDGDPGIRADAARVLALAAGAGKVSAKVGSSLVERLDDTSRDVRMIAVRAVAALGSEAPKDTAAAMARAFERGDEGEKLVLLRAARDLGSGELVQVGVGDASPLVRVEAVDLSIATDTRVAATIATALADADPQVRRAALGRIASDKDKLDAAAVDRALALGIRDPDPELSQLALTTLARVADKESVLARLGRALTSRAESDRAKAAAAAIGLVERDAPAAVTLLTPLLSDPSHDVRVAMLPSLGGAYATTNSPEQLAAILRGSERDAMKRLVATAAFVILARTDGGRSAAETALGAIAKSGPPMARRNAQLALGLIGAGADGLTFLQQLVY